MILHFESRSINEVWWLLPDPDCHTTPWLWEEEEINGSRGDKRYKKSAQCLGHHNSGGTRDSLYLCVVISWKGENGKIIALNILSNLMQ